MATFDRNPDTIRMTQHADTVTNLRFRHSRAKPFNKPTFETDVVFVVWHNSHGDSDIFEIDTRSHHLNGRSWGRKYSAHIAGSVTFAKGGIYLHLAC